MDGCRYGRDGSIEGAIGPEGFDEIVRVRLCVPAAQVTEHDDHGDHGDITQSPHTSEAQADCCAETPHGAPPLTLLSIVKRCRLLLPEAHEASQVAQGVHEVCLPACRHLQIDAYRHVCEACACGNLVNEGWHDPTSRAGFHLLVSVPAPAIPTCFILAPAIPHVSTQAELW